MLASSSIHTFSTSLFNYKYLIILHGKKKERKYTEVQSQQSFKMMQTRTEKPLSPESDAKVVFTSEQLSLAHYHCMVNFTV